MAGKFILGAWLACTMCLSALTAEESKEAPKKDDYPPFQSVQLDLKPGERLTFDISWGIIHAGHTVLCVTNKENLDLTNSLSPKVWNILCQTRSTSFMSNFYEVHDDILSCIDANEGFSHLFDMNKNEGAVHGVERIAFHYDRNEADYFNTKRQKDGSFRTNSLVIPLPGKVHDPLSCLYYIRAMDLKIGQQYKMTVNTAKKNWVMTLKVLRREKISVAGLGEVQALVVEPVAQFEGIFVTKGQMTVWLDDRTKTPLLMKVAVPVIGHVTAELVHFENSPLNSPAAENTQKP